MLPYVSKEAGVTEQQQKQYHEHLSGITILFFFTINPELHVIMAILILMRSVAKRFYEICYISYFSLVGHL